MLLLRRIVGTSMLPTLRPDQIVVVLRPAKYKSGDVVVVRHHGIEKIKRIAELQNDTVYLEGDNTAASTDSRHFGYLPSTVIKGKVIWPRNLTNPMYQK